MRAARAVVLAAAALGAAAASARADGELSMRGVYYKEHATRVEQPMLDGKFDAGEGGTVDAHFLVDAITSASAGSGAGKTPFTEHRYEVGAGYTRQLASPTRVGAFGRVSIEPDYESVFGAGHLERDLADKNFTLAVTLGGGRDHITNGSAQNTLGAISEHLTTSLASISATQILSRNTVGALIYDVAYLKGYLASPYRTVVTADGLTPERFPGSRTRHAVAAFVRRYLPETATTVIAGYRLYIDDWGVVAHTPEVRVVQAAGDTMDLGLGLRYYRQSAADFYKSVYPTSNPAMEPYLADDPKLSKFDGETITAKFGVMGSAFELPGRWARARGEVIFEYVVQHNRFGNAAIAHVALTVPFDY